MDAWAIGHGANGLGVTGDGKHMTTRRSVLSLPLTCSPRLRHLLLRRLLGFPAGESSQRMEKNGGMGRSFSLSPLRVHHKPSFL